MNDNKLKIRIQIQQPQQPQQAIEQIYPDLSEPEIVYEQSLNWKKISITVLLLLFVLALIAYLLFGTNQHEAQLNEAAPVIDQTISPQENKISVEETTPQPEIADKAAKIESSLSLPESNDFSDVVQPKDAIQSAEIIRPIEQIVIPIVQPKPAAIANKPAVIPRKKPQVAPQSKPQEVSDHHPQVLRAQLSHDRQAREPVDASGAVQLREDESKPIYFYLHLKDLQGEKISILWYRDNKLDSQLFLEIHNNNWRTNASKQLDHQRLGAWRVEVVDESGNRLATRNFTVTQH